MYGDAEIKDCDRAGLLNNNKKSEQLELLSRGVWLNRLLAVEQLNGAKLLVCYAKHADMAILRKK